MAGLLHTLRSGRRVGLTTLGNPDEDRLVVLCHPAPGSSVFDPDPGISATHGAHIVALDRPGYGSSDPWPPYVWPSITAAADDIAEYLRAVVRAEEDIGARRPKTVGAVGWSAGGRVALALAARHPELVDRVAIVATPAPNDAVPWIDPGLQAISDQLGRKPPGEAIEELAAMLQPQAEAVRRADEPGDVPLGPFVTGPGDQALLARPGLHERLGMMLKDALRHGTRGLAADILSYTARPWGFELGRVRADTLVVAGEADPIAGAAHASWYAGALPNARVEVFPDVGHLVVALAWERVLEHVAP